MEQGQLHLTFIKNKATYIENYIRSMDTFIVTYIWTQANLLYVGNKVFVQLLGLKKGYLCCNLYREKVNYAFTYNKNKVLIQYFMLRTQLLIRRTSLLLMLQRLIQIRLWRLISRVDGAYQQGSIKVVSLIIYNYLYV